MFEASHVLQGEDQTRPTTEFFPVISANYAVDEETYLGELLQLADPGPDGVKTIRRNARTPIETVHSRDNAVGTPGTPLRRCGLDAREGLMLMCLTEALLYVPGAATVNALIRSKLSAVDWQCHLSQGDNVLVNFTAWGLVMTSKAVNIVKRTDGRVPSVTSRLMQHSDEPVIRAAMSQAMKLMGK